MDPFLARTMVETLSKGIDPLTGRALSLKDSGSNERIQDALIEVLEHCAIESVEQYSVRLAEEKKQQREERKLEREERYPRGGLPWSEEEEKELLSMHRRGMNIYHIANILKRTPGGISSRLKMMQCVPIKRSKKPEKWTLY